MSARALQPGSKNLYVGGVRLAGTLTIGATGAVGTLTMRGVTSVTRTGTGAYRFLLHEPYKTLVGWNIRPLLASAGDILHPVINAEDVDGATTPYIDIIFYNNSAAAADPASGTKLFIEFELANSSLAIG